MNSSGIHSNNTWTWKGRTIHWLLANHHQQQKPELSILLIHGFGANTNHWRFNHQVKGLDLRDLTRDQFDGFGRLVDTSFQVPRELGQMNVGN